MKLSDLLCAVATIVVLAALVVAAVSKAHRRAAIGIARAYLWHELRLEAAANEVTPTEYEAWIMSNSPGKRTYQP